MSSPSGTVLKPGTRFRWHYIIPTLFVTQAVGMVDKVNVGIVMAFKPFLQDMHLVNQPALAGMLMTWFLLAYGIGMPVWGAISDRIGPRRVGMAGLLIWVLMLALGGISSNLTVLYISRIGLGFGEAFMWPVCNNLTARWFPLSERSRANSFWINGINFGVALAGILVTGIMASLGWRPLFFILAAIAFLPLALFFAFTRDDPRQVNQVDAAELQLIEAGSLVNGIGDDTPESTKTLFSNYRFWLLALADIATVTGVFGINTWIPSYLTQTRHISMASLGLFISLTWLLCIGVLYLFGKWSDKLMRKAPFAAVSFVVAGVTIWGAAFVSTPLEAMILVGLSIWAVQTALHACHSLLHSLVKTSQMGLANGVMTGVANIIGAFAPVIMGVLIGQSHNYLTSFIFLGIISLAAAVLVGILIPQESAFAKSYKGRTSRNRVDELPAR